MMNENVILVGEGSSLIYPPLKKEHDSEKVDLKDKSVDYVHGKLIGIEYIDNGARVTLQYNYKFLGITHWMMRSYIYEPFITFSNPHIGIQYPMLYKDVEYKPSSIFPSQTFFSRKPETTAFLTEENAIKSNSSSPESH